MRFHFLPFFCFIINMFLSRRFFIIIPMRIKPLLTKERGIKWREELWWSHWANVRPWHTSWLGPVIHFLNSKIYSSNFLSTWITSPRELKGLKTSSTCLCTTPDFDRHCMRIVSLRKRSTRKFYRIPRIPSFDQKWSSRKEISNGVLGSSVSPLEAEILQKEARSQVTVQHLASPYTRPQNQTARDHTV